MQSRGQMSKMEISGCSDDQASLGRAGLVSGLNSASFAVRGTFVYTPWDTSPTSSVEFVIQLSEFVSTVTFSFILL